MHWVIDSKITNTGTLDYLDNFLFVGSSDFNDCLTSLNKFIKMSKFFGIPLAKEKTVFPSSCIEFLGITIDSINMEFFLPKNKILRLKNLLNKLLMSNKTTLHEL